MAGTMDHRLIKQINGSWEKQMGLEEPRERSSKPLSIMWCRKVRMSHSRPEVMK